MHKVLRTAHLFLLIGVLLFGFVPPAASAPLSLQSAVTRMTMIPGQTWSGSIRIANYGEQPVTVEIDSVNLIPGIEEGTAPIPLIRESKADRSVSLAGWMDLPNQQLVIEPRSIADVPVSITVPSYAGHGLHRAAVIFRQQGAHFGQDGTEITATITSGFAVDIVNTHTSLHDLQLSLFRMSSMFSTRFPVDLNIRIENNGTTLGVLDGHITVDSILGSAQMQVPVTTREQGRYVKPGSSFEHTYTLTDVMVGSGAGLYRARVYVVNGGNSIEKNTYFVVVPASLTIVLLSTLLISVGGVRLAVKSSQKKRRKQ